MLAGALADLRAAGRQESSGHFSLDLNKSLQKLASFQLQEPLRYADFLVATATHVGATYIQFQVGVGDVVACFDGRPFRASELADLFYSLFETPSGPSARASQNLAFALNVTRQLGPKFVVFDSCSPAGGTRLQITERLLEVGPLRSRPWQEDAIVHRFHLQMERDLSLLVRLQTDEQAVLRSGPCDFALLPVWINGRPLRTDVDAVLELWDCGDGLRPAGLSLDLPARASEWSGGLALSGRPGGMRWVLDGLAYPDPSVRLPRGVVAWVYLDDAKTDLSRASLVESESLIRQRREVQRLIDLRIIDLKAELRAMPGVAQRYPEFV